MNERPLNILLGYEESQAVCIELRKLGHNAYSNDILDCSGGHPEWHLKMSVYEAIKLKRWDAAIFFTPCTYSCNSGVRWLAKDGKIINKERCDLMLEYAGMLRDMLNSSIQSVGCENPIPHKYALEVIGRKYDQIIQPWQFGHGESKATCLWLKNLPKLKPTKIVNGREQKIWKLPPGEDRSKLRSKTYPGIACAMAEQWSEYLINQLA
ncbi:hypothetical protein [uncultured Parabacteroides sp.]|uniref:hypothetical protein n=1 Tax=uncultured Parabacteroides sp. TaxID=512312 RepID=UPI002657B4D7|nr:hypothetical protein [uncultured Parabacteroides sp.]